MIGSKIKNTKKVDDLKIGITLSDGNEPIELEVTTFDNLGNQFLSHITPSKKMCEKCGKLIKVKGKNMHYCNTCSKLMELEKYKKYNEKR